VGRSPLVPDGGISLRPGNSTQAAFAVRTVVCR
jgi:Sigma-70, region 4